MAPFENCDDGNNVDSDGLPKTTACFSSCGNGIVESPEECDDGNADNTDACLNTCVHAYCGDGFSRS